MKNSILVIILCCLAFTKTGFAEDKPDLVYWDSAEGIELRSNILADADYWQLISHFAIQNTQTFCGVASAVTVLNAMPIEKPIDRIYAPFPYFTQNNFFNAEVEKVVSQDEVLTSGMTREQMTAVLTHQGVKAETVAGDSLDNDSLRDFLQKTLGDDGRFVLVNYARPTLGQLGGGHWSVLAAFDEESDRVLILDVAKYKYAPVWVEVSLLQQAISTIDSGSHKARGLVVVFQ